MESLHKMLATLKPQPANTTRAPTIGDAAFYPISDMNIVSPEIKNNDNKVTHPDVDLITRGSLSGNDGVSASRIGGASSFPVNSGIVIDPGHGGVDPGTVKDGVVEKEVTLDISKRLQAYFERKKHTVILTRNGDTSVSKLSFSDGYTQQGDLNARVSIINHSNAELYLCIMLIVIRMSKKVVLLYITMLMIPYPRFWQQVSRDI